MAPGAKQSTLTDIHNPYTNTSGEILINKVSYIEVTIQ